MAPERTTLPAAVAAYLDAWNAHDAPGVTAALAPDGTYRDPTTATPVSGARLEQVVRGWLDAFPDLGFHPESITADENRCVVEWTLRGHNRGPFRPGINATGREVVLAGVSVFELEAQRIRAVRVHLDQHALVEGMGLMSLVQPVEQGPARFGYSMRVPSGNPRPPGVIALTWIQGANDTEKERIRAHSRENVKDFLAEPGFISMVTGFTGLRGFTVTAWEDEASMKRALSGHHAVAMKELFGEDFVASVWTSVWTPTRVNRLWVRCTACHALEDLSDDHRACTRCHAPLPPRPAYW